MFTVFRACGDKQDLLTELSNIIHLAFSLQARHDEKVGYVWFF